MTPSVTPPTLREIALRLVLESERPGGDAHEIESALREAHRRGQEAMRERAAQTAEDYACPHWLWLSAAIRALSVEEP